MQETEASKKAMAEAEHAEAAKHKKWQEAEKAGRAADEYAAKKLDKVEEVLHSKMEAMAKKAKVGFAAESELIARMLFSVWSLNKHGRANS